MSGMERKTDSGVYISESGALDAPDAPDALDVVVLPNKERVQFPGLDAGDCAIQLLKMDQPRIGPVVDLPGAYASMFRKICSVAKLSRTFTEYVGVEYNPEAPFVPSGYPDIEFRSGLAYSRHIHAYLRETGVPATILPGCDVAFFPEAYRKKRGKDFNYYNGTMLLDACSTRDIHYFGKRWKDSDMAKNMRVLITTDARRWQRLDMDPAFTFMSNFCTGAEIIGRLAFVKRGRVHNGLRIATLFKYGGS